MARPMIFGMIGGAGVAATNCFNNKLENKLTSVGAYRDQHHPEVICYQATNVPSRSMYFEGRGPSFVPGYIDIAKRLERFGADILFMNCNTAHAAFDEISSSVNIGFINLIDEVINVAINDGSKKIGIMASDGTLNSEIYKKYFNKRLPKANLVYPKPEMQELLTKGIINIKNKNRFLSIDCPDRPSFIFDKVSESLCDEKVDTIILGCTDISVDYNYQNNLINIIDSVDVLVQKVLQLHFESTNFDAQ